MINFIYFSWPFAASWYFSVVVVVGWSCLGLLGWGGDFRDFEGFVWRWLFFFFAGKIYFGSRKIYLRKYVIGVLSKSQCLTGPAK